MNREEVINLGHAAGFDRAYLSEDSALSLLTLLERFAVEAQRREREACAYRAGIALLGADRGLANRVDQAIRARGNT